MTTTAKVTRHDLEAKLREMSGELDQEVDAARPRLVAGAAVGVVVMLVLVYLLGRRRGRARSAVVEIRRL